MTFDPRFMAGPAQLVAGGLLVTIALRLWLVHPINRVFRLGAYVTAEGMEALLRSRLVIFSFGMMLVTGGINRSVYWFFSHNVYNTTVVFCGSLEAIWAVWSGAMAIRIAWRLWVSK